MIHVQASPPEHHDWIASRAGLSLHAGFMALEAMDDAGRIVGMVGFDGWTPSSVALHVALDTPSALRHLIYPVFGLVFDPEPEGCGKRRINLTVLSTNTRSLALVKHLGFKETHRVKDGWDLGVDIVVFEMRREHCRWIRHETEEVWAA